NIGFSNCDMAIFRKGEIEHYSQGSIAGILVHTTIRNYLKKAHGIHVTEATLENIVRTLGTVVQETDPIILSIQGSDIKNHTLTSASISSNDIAFLLSPLAEQLSQWILRFLSRLPVDTQKDIMTRGIVCSGGFVTITGMRRRLQELIGCPVYLTDQPLYTIITGLEIVLSQMA
ncbi:rod shape-determining protein, partial [uncultured Dubosiella sp.]